MITSVYIQITDGVVQNRTTLANAIKSLPTGRYEFSFKPKSLRSLNQNAYLHAVCFQFTLAGLRDMGWNDFTTVSQVKSFLKNRFLKVSVVNPETGEVFDYVRNTRDLSKLEMVQFIDDIAQFNSEYLNQILPMPNEQLTMTI